VNQEPTVTGPVVRDDNGAHVYTVSGDGREVKFALIPEPSPSGPTSWAVGVEGREEPYEPGYPTLDQAYAAGLRLATAAIERELRR
jgi:hypothetical protein